MVPEETQRDQRLTHYSTSHRVSFSRLLEELFQSSLAHWIKGYEKIRIITPTIPKSLTKDSLNEIARIIEGIVTQLQRIAFCGRQFCESEATCLE